MTPGNYGCQYLRVAKNGLLFKEKATNLNIICSVNINKEVMVTSTFQTHVIRFVFEPVFVEDQRPCIC